MDYPDCMTIAPRLLHWFDHHGRHDLPWQQDRSPYRVWVSEIMLQQTQVTTVIPYYQRFMARFADVEALAAAPLDDLLHHWSGLGYYARARNLHRAAQQICQQHAGRFPNRLDEVMALPGIGRSTAGAILAIACGQRHPILDGNVKRVLCRYHAIDGWPGTRAVEKALWQLAEAHTPARRVADYTQAIMDLGATLCRRTRPRCQDCPLRQGCLALAHDRQAELPTPRPKKKIPTRQTAMLLLRNPRGETLLQHRPPAGIWGGLWSFPELGANLDDEAIRHWCRDTLGHEIVVESRWPRLRHTFSHFHLDIEPVVANVIAEQLSIAEASPQRWHPVGEPPDFGLAAPVHTLLQRLGESP